MNATPWERHAPILFLSLVTCLSLVSCQKGERTPGKTMDSDSAVGDSETETGDTGEPDSEDTGDSEDSGDSEDTEDSDPVRILQVDDYAYTIVHGEEYQNLGGPVVLGDVSGDGIDDFCMEDSYGGDCAGWNSPLEPGVFSSYEADFLMEAGSMYRVGTPGDVNGDGISDIVQGDSLILGPLSGRLNSSDGDVRFVYDSGAYDLATQQGFWGDSDGDGVYEVVLNLWDRTRQDRLMIFDNIDGSSINVEDRTAEIVGSTSAWSSDNDRFGFVGDINGDGMDDITFLHGNCIAYGPLPDWSDGWESSVGSPLAEPAGDLNLDGYDDLIAGHLKEVLIYHGPIEGNIEAEDAWARILLVDADEGGIRNSEPASAGDVNADGVPDVMFAYGSRVRVFLSPIEGTLVDSEAQGKLGVSGAIKVFTDGQTDFSGDGVPELIVGEEEGDYALYGGVGWVLLGGTWL